MLVFQGCGDWYRIGDQITKTEVPCPGILILFAMACHVRYVPWGLKPHLFPVLGDSHQPNSKGLNLYNDSLLRVG